MFDIESGWAGGLNRVLLEAQALGGGGWLDVAEPLVETSPLLTAMQAVSQWISG